MQQRRINPGGDSRRRLGAHRGLGAVVIGRLLLSTVITLALTPLALTLSFDLRESAIRRLGFQPAVAGESAAG